MLNMLKTLGLEGIKLEGAKGQKKNKGQNRKSGSAPFLLRDRLLNISAVYQLGFSAVPLKYVHRTNQVFERKTNSRAARKQEHEDRFFDKYILHALGIHLGICVDER